MTSKTSNALPAPHGGSLIDLLAHNEALEQVRQLASELPSITLNERQLCDLELLLNGGFSPLTGYLKQADYDSVCKHMQLADGTLWPMPITLDIGRELAASLSVGDQLTLRESEGMALAVLTIESIWEPDLMDEARQVFGSEDDKHPAVAWLKHHTGAVYLGGKLQGIQLPHHYDCRHLRHTPAELRAYFDKMGWHRVVAFQTRNPMHRAHQELTFAAARQAEANLLIHPVVGMTKPGDVDYLTRVRCYEELLKRYPEDTTMLSLLPLAMRMGGPREALWHALIRKNFGCSHFIVGRDHAGPGNDSKDQPFYDPFEAQRLMHEHADELGIEMVPFKMMVYVQERAEYVPSDEVHEGETVLNISGTELRRRLAKGLDIPEWFTFAEVVEELQRRYPPRAKQGFTIFFTGLSGAGKSTIANALLIKLNEIGTRPVTLLDGDIVRTHLSSELGFSREHRDINVRRIGYVASEITKNGGVAICAPIAPYAHTRQQVREMIEPVGGFLEVFVSTSLAVCEQRDRKGLYAKARRGEIKEFTGISDPYEKPQTPELELDTDELSPEQSVQQILIELERMGLLSIRR